LVQPHAWLNATFDPMLTVTGAWAHLQVRVPPVKFGLPFFTPLSTEG
jgi:hypothetical protein